MTRLEMVAIVCGVLGVALAWALFSRYAWKARALYLYEVLSGNQRDGDSEDNFTGTIERRGIPRLLKKSSLNSRTVTPVDLPKDEGPEPQKKTG